MGDIPDWASRKAIDKANAMVIAPDMPFSFEARHHLLYPSIKALAAYIAAHEEAPIDPLLTELHAALRSAASEMPFSIDDNLLDSDGANVREFVTEVRAQLTRRGIEIAGGGNG